MKLLITGGCGFLGSNLAADALSLGDELLVFDNLHRDGSTANLAWLRSLGTFEFEHGDIRNANDVARVVVKFRPDAIFHLAGQVAMITSLSNPRLDFEVNTLGTLNVLESAREHVPEAAVFFSSTNKVYGDLRQFTYRETRTRYECVERPNGFAEDTPLDFHSPYGCSKGAAEQYVADYARMFGLRTVVFRHSSMYGGRQYATYDQGWIGWFCQQALFAKSGRLTKPFTISGNGKQVRDVLHAQDLVSLYRAALSQIDKVFGQVFNIGGGTRNSLSLLELFALLEERLGTRLEYINLPPREGDQRVFVADITRARKVLGWEPRMEYREGIRSMLGWIEHSS